MVRGRGMMNVVASRGGGSEKPLWGEMAAATPCQGDPARERDVSVSVVSCGEGVIFF